MKTWKTLSKLCQEAVEDGMGDMPVFHFLLDAEAVNDFFEETPLTTEQIIRGFEAADPERDYFFEGIMNRIKASLED
jgi:hypothetical protein